MTEHTQGGASPRRQEACLSPKTLRQLTHPECNAYCRGDRHALILWYNPIAKDGLRLDSGMQGSADDLDAVLISFQETFEVPKEDGFNRYGDKGKLPATAVPYLCFFEFKVGGQPDVCCSAPV